MSQIRALLLHDSPEDAALIERAFKEGGLDAHWRRISSADRFSAALADEAWDVLISAYEVPGFGALEALKMLHAAGLVIPCIVIAESFGEARVIALMRAGARDCILKSNLSTLVAAVQHELPLAATRRARRVLELKHQHLAALVEHSADAIIGVTMEGNIISWNTAAEALYGWSASEALGQHIAIIVPPDRADELPDMLARIRRGDRAPHKDTERLRKDGTRVDVSLTISPIHDGVLVGMSKTARDMTERRRTEDVTARAELLLANVQDAVVVTDLAGTVTYWNEGAVRIFGWTIEETLGKPLWTRLQDGGRKKMQELIASVGAGEAFSGEWEDVHKNGSALWVDNRVARILDRSGAPIAILGTSHDVTARKLAETERDRLLEQHQLHIDQMPLAYLRFDKDLALADWNPAAERVFGYRKDEVLGMTPPYEKLISPEAFDTARDVFEAIRNGEASASSVSENLTKDGRSISCEWHNTRLADPEGNFAGMVSLGEDVSARISSAEAMVLRDRAIQAVGVGIIITDPRQKDNPIIFVSPGFEKLTGYAPAEALGRNSRFLEAPDADEATSVRLRDAIRAGKACTVEILNRKKDGTAFWNELSVSPVRNERGDLVNFVGIHTDVTQRRLLEEQLRQAQKMDAVGQLAGGVAHDFNNLLTVIIGYSVLLLDDLGPTDPNRDLVELIQKAGNQSAGLTRQLLMFSRQEVVVPKVLNLNDILTEMERMLRRIIGEDILFVTEQSSDLRDIKIDAGQLEQVIMNLAVNARDAMPRGGKLTIKTSEVNLGPTDISFPGAGLTGPYVVMSVTDTGCGMTPAVRAKLFEPFFTTKGAGKGTGLGLAVVHGIVKQNEGHIEVTTAPGRGTCFKIYLPSLESRDQASAPERHVAPPPGTETVLLVEDDDVVRELASRILTKCGYEVLQSSCGRDALALAKGHDGPIDLLITDVVMPDQGGKQVAERICATRKNIKVLYVSGYTDDSVIRHGVLHSEINFLEKPFTPVGLATMVRGILDQVEPAKN